MYAISPLKPSQGIHAGIAAGGSTCAHGPAVVELPKFGIWDLAFGMGGIDSDVSEADRDPHERWTERTAIDSPSYRGAPLACLRRTMAAVSRVPAR